MANFLSGGMLGGNISSANPTSDGPTALSSQGIITNWYNNTTYAGGLARYVYAASAISGFDVVAIDAGGTAASLTTTLGTLGAYQIGFADFYTAGFASGDYGWVKLTGPATPNVLTLCAKYVPLYTSATAGKLDDTSTGFNLVRGVWLTASNSGSTNNIAAMANWPALAPGGSV